MSTTSDSEDRALSLVIASTPFDDQNADAAIRTCDSVTFYVSKSTLTTISPVFTEKFASHPRSEADPQAVIEVEEDSDLFRSLLLWCDARCDARSIPVVGTLDGLGVLLDAARKYQMDAVEIRIAVLTISSFEFIRLEPVRVFAIAARYVAKHPHMSEILRVAARRTLLHRTPLSRCKELDQVPASALQTLYDYHAACGKVARTLTENFRWARSGETPPWVNCKQKGCTKSRDYIGYGTGGGHMSQWWMDYMNLAGDALLVKPCKDTVWELDLSAPLRMAAFTCPGCGMMDPPVYTALKEFNKLLAEEVEKVVDQVKFEMA